MSGVTCPTCDKTMTGVMLVDWHEGEQLRGEARLFCQPCAEKEREVTHPWRKHPFGETFRQARVSRHVSLHDMAKLLGMTAEQVSGVEHGKYPPPLAGEVHRWWNALDVTS